MALLSKILDPIFGSDTSASDAAAKKYLKQATDAYGNIQAPDDKVTDAQAYTDLGGYTPGTVADPGKLSYDLSDPRLASLSSMGDSAMSGISVDPRLKQNQNNSLDALSQIVQGGGMTAQDKANMAKMQSEVAQADRGRREAIMQNMGSRGMGGSGMELLSQLQSGQAATDRASQSGLDIAGQAQARALDAIAQSGTLSGAMRDQDFGEQSKVAQAKDAINQFNTANANANSLANANMTNANSLSRANGMLTANQGNVSNQMNTNQFNANAQTDAAKYAQGNAQGIANQNTAAKNSTQALRDALPQQNFSNQMQIAGGKAGVAQGGVNYYDKQSGRTVAKDSNYLDALVKGGSEYAGS